MLEREGKVLEKNWAGEQDQGRPGSGRITVCRARQREGRPVKRGLSPGPE